MSVGAVEDQDTGAEDTGVDESTETTETVEEGSPSEERTPVDNPSRPTRAQRRADRAAEHSARAEAAELRKAIESERERARALEASVAEMRGYVQAQRQRETTPADDTDKKISELRADAKRHLNYAARAQSPEVAEREMDAYHAKLQEAAELGAERRFTKRFDEFRQSAPNQQQVATQSQLMHEFPWVSTDHAAAQYAGALEQQMIQSGKPANIATARAALAEAAKRLGIGGRTAPSPEARNAYAGVSSREGAPGEGGGNGKQQFHPERMDKDQKRLAEQAFPKLEPALAWNAWSKRMNAHFAKGG